jgi:LacI family transcriptional regulator
MSKRPTISDLAREAGVGTATVDRVLNGRAKVRSDTARKIYLAAEKIGYHAAPLLRERLYSDLPERRLGLLLQKENQEFYKTFAQVFQAKAQACPGVRCKPDIIFASSQSPEEQAGLLADLGRRTHAVAATAVNHHDLTHTVRDLKRRSVPVFTLLNDFAQEVRHSYVGLNNMKIGRMAAWTLYNTPQPPGKIAVFVGGSRWHGHALRETGFRSFFREHPVKHSLLDTMVNLETRAVTYEATLDLLRRHADLRGIFVAGGGMEGAIDAVREMRQPGEVAMVVNELTDVSTRALQEGYLTLIDSTPLDQLCQNLVETMVHATSLNASDPPGQIFLQPEIYIPESL